MKKYLLAGLVGLAITPQAHAFFGPNFTQEVKEHFDAESRILGVASLGSLAASGYLVHTGINQRNWLKVGAGVGCGLFCCALAVGWASVKLQGAFAVQYLSK